MAIGKHRATGPHPKGRNVMEDGAGRASCIARKPRAGVSRARRGRRSDRAVAGSRSGCAAGEPGVRYARKKGRSGRTPVSGRGRSLAHGAETDEADGFTKFSNPTIISGPDAARRRETMPCRHVRLHHLADVWRKPHGPAGGSQDQPCTEPSCCDRSIVGRCRLPISFVNWALRRSALSERRSASIARPRRPAFSVASCRS